jgi:hypothetical protein
MSDLIKALSIFLKYKDEKYPTHCEHDELWICGYNDIDISEEDVMLLADLGFRRYSEGWKSFRYGSC